MESFFRAAVTVDDAIDETGGRADGFSRTLSISQSGDLFLADARGSIRSVDVRAELLRGALSQAPGADAARTTAPPCASTRITYMASSGSPFMVCATAVSPTGTFLAASGHSVVNNCAHVRVLDLSRCDATRRIEVKSKPKSITETAHAVDIGASTFSKTPGLRILQIDWHPASEHHLLVLTSASTLLMFDVRGSPDSPELTLRLNLSGGPSAAGMSFGLSERSSSAKSSAAPAGSAPIPALYPPPKRSPAPSASPGRRGRGSAGAAGSGDTPAAFVCGGAVRGGAAPWAMMAVHVVSRAGRVFTVCPVCPGGMRLTAGDVSDMRQALLDMDDAPGVVPSEGKEWMQAVLRVDENGMAVADAREAGRFVPAVQGPLEVSRSFAEQPDEAVSHARTDSALLLQHHMCLALVTSSAHAVVTHVLGGDCAPAFHSTPSRSSPPPRAPGTHFLMLMDVVSVVDAPMKQDAMGSAGEGPESDDDANVDMCAGEVWGSLLLPDAALSSRLYVLCSMGALSITLPWMPVVASFLVRVSRADASSSASARLSIASLPDPIVETLSADPDIATAASVGSELTGSVLLVVDTMGGHACLRPYDDSEEGHGGSHGRMSLERGSQVRRGGTPGERGGSLSPLARGLSASVPRAASQEPQGGAGAAGPLSQKRIEEIERTVQECYRDILAGPKPAGSLPTGTDVAADSPEGRKALMDASAVLRKQYVAFAAHAHAVLTARIKAIQSTAGDLCGSVDRLRERLQSAMDDERALAGRFDACDKLMGSLEERLTISADLLDSLPRPLRPAEEAWESELAWIEREALPELEGKVAALRQESEGVLTEAKGLRKGKGMAEPQSADRRRLAGGTLTGRAMLTGLRMPSVSPAATPTSAREAAAARRVLLTQARLWECQALLASMMPQNGASAGGDADSDGVADEISLDGGGIVDRIEGVVI